MVPAYRANIARKFSSDSFASIKRAHARRAAPASASPSPNKRSSAMAGEFFSKAIRMVAAFFGSNLKPEENFRISEVPMTQLRLSIARVHVSESAYEVHAAPR